MTCASVYVSNWFFSVLFGEGKKKHILRGISFEFYPLKNDKTVTKYNLHSFTVKLASKQTET